MKQRFNFHIFLPFTVRGLASSTPVITQSVIHNMLLLRFQPGSSCLVTSPYTTHQPTTHTQLRMSFKKSSTITYQLSPSMTPIRIKSKPWSCVLLHLFPSCTHTTHTHTFPHPPPFCCSSKTLFPISYFLHLLLFLLPKILLPNKTFYKDWLLKSFTLRSLFR